MKEVVEMTVYLDFIEDFPLQHRVWLCYGWVRLDAVEIDLD